MRGDIVVTQPGNPGLTAWFPLGLLELKRAHVASGHITAGLRTAIEPPPKGWGAPSLNFVGLTTRSLAMTEANGWWFETVAPERLRPRDLHAAQLARRLGPAAR